MGLIAHLGHLSYAEDIVAMANRLVARGQALMGEIPKHDVPPKTILCAERVRRTPPSFSWVDHRLVRQRYLMRAPAQAWALYLVLVTAGDEHPLSNFWGPLHLSHFTTALHLFASN